MVRQNSAIKSDVAKTSKHLAHPKLQGKAILAAFPVPAGHFSSFTDTLLAAVLRVDVASRVILSLMHAATVRNQHTLAITQDVARVTLATLLTTSTTFCWRGQSKAHNRTSRSTQLIVAILRA